MSTWSPQGAADVEVLSYGSGKDLPPGPRARRKWTLTAAVLLLGLLAGSLAQQALARGSPGQRSSVAHPVAVGAIDRVPEAFSSDRFELPVFNPGSQAMEVSVTGLPGIAPVIAATGRTDVGPGTWGTLMFSAPADCSRYVGGATVPAVQLRVVRETGVEETRVPLPEQGAALTTYLDALCASPPTIRPDQLYGDWLLDRVYGQQTGFEGILVLRFATDGAFTTDPQGVLFGRGNGVRGSYRLHDDRLRIDVTGGYGCVPGSHASWRVSPGADETLVLVWRHGSCPQGPDDVWIARRVLRDVGVPSAQLRRSRISAMP